MRNEPIIRPALIADRRAVTVMLAAAFQNDPAMSFIFPDPKIRAVRLPGLFKILFDGDSPRGSCYVTEGGEAATLWRAPDHARLSLYEKITFALPWIAAAGPALGRALAYSDASDANHPKTPHWYLHIAGCAPSAQGHGFGGAAIRAGLERADNERMPVYLETAKEVNVELYLRFGFEITHQWSVPKGPISWSMLRPTC